MIERIERLPIPAVATCLSALTMANVYGGLGFIWVRWFVMGCGSLLILTYITKILLYRKTCLKEYAQTIPSSLYGSFCMCVMILGSFYYEMGFGPGKIIWAIGVALHFIQILVFTIMHSLGKVFLKNNFVPMMPSWYVTYNGWMVACVSGGAMNAGPVLKVITVYGCIIYVFLLPFMIWRLLNVEIKEGTYHTMAVLLAPCSLCVVSLINVYGSPNEIVLGFLYLCVLATLAFILFKLPDFFSFTFYPGFAGLTFPMAIGVVASQKMAGYLNGAGKEALGNACTQIAGFQIWVTSMIVGYVTLMLLRMLFRKEARG